MLPVSDKTISVIEYALNALEKRSQVTANNVANSEVPGFAASRVNFEAELARAIAGRGPERIGSAEITRAPGVADETGNTVNLESEVVDMIKTNLLQQSMVEAFNFKTGLLRSAIRGQ